MAVRELQKITGKECLRDSCTSTKQDLEEPAELACGSEVWATDVEAAKWDDRPGCAVTLVLTNGVGIDVDLYANLSVTSNEIDD